MRSWSERDSPKSTENLLFFPFDQAVLTEAEPAEFEEGLKEKEIEEKDKKTRRQRREVVKGKEVQVCNCRKSMCLKLYCECFSRGNLCSKECKCQECLNKNEQKEIREEIVRETMEKNSLAFRPKFKTHQRLSAPIHARGCSCEKTECVKSYCECFRAGAGCTRMCRCRACKNKQINLDDIEVPQYYEKIIRKRKKVSDLSLKIKRSIFVSAKKTLQASQEDKCS